MAFRSLMTARRKRIALIAHDNMKPDILEWATYNRGTLARHELFATGTTGGMLAAELGLVVHRFRSGPLDGGTQVPAVIEIVVLFDLRQYLAHYILWQSLGELFGQSQSLLGSFLVRCSDGQTQDDIELIARV
jgi:hypothetical protein